MGLSSIEYLKSDICSNSQLRKSLGVSTSWIKTLSSLLPKMLSLKVLLLRTHNLKELPSDLEGYSRLAVLELSVNTFPEEEQNRIKELLSNTNLVF